MCNEEGLRQLDLEIQELEQKPISEVHEAYNHTQESIWGIEQQVRPLEDTLVVGEGRMEMLVSLRGNQEVFSSQTYQSYIFTC